MAAEEVVKSRVITDIFGGKYIPKGIWMWVVKEELKITPIFWVKVTGKMELLLTEIGNTS